MLSNIYTEKVLAYILKLALAFNKRRLILSFKINPIFPVYSLVHESFYPVFNHYPSAALMKTKGTYISCICMKKHDSV